MKRVLIVNYEFPPVGGGGGVAAHALAKGFIQNGYEVDYLTSWYEGLKKFEVVDGINVHRVRVIGRTGLQTATMISLLTYPLTGFLPGIRLCRSRKYAFINTHFVLPSGPLGYILAKLFSIPNILSIHGGDIYDPSKKNSPHKHWYFRAAVRFLLNQADRVVAQSSNTKENAERFYIPKNPIEIIPLAYERAEFVRATREELGLIAGKKYIIGVGRLVKRKDFPTFLHALAKLDADIEGIIVGDGPERAALENLSRVLGITDRLHMVGNVDNNQKYQYLSNADVFVLSSLHEGFGIVLQEAMQVGLPIVSTNVGGQVDLVRQGENGYLVPVGDAELLAEAVRKALTERLPGLGNQIEGFIPAAIAARYLELV